MAQNIPQVQLDQTGGHMPAPRTLLLWVALAAVVVVIVAMGLASHRPGVPTVTPGKIAPSATQTALNSLTDGLQGLVIAHRKASSRQADANG